MNAPKTLPQIWGEEIRKARTELGLSIVQLAADVGMDPAHLSRGERGLAGIGDDYRVALAKRLDRPTAQLFPYPDTFPLERSCPRAATAPDAASSPTPATTAATRSPARAAKAQADSAPEGSPGNE